MILIVAQNEWLATDSQNAVLNNFEQYQNNELSYKMVLSCDNLILRSLTYSVVFLYENFLFTKNTLPLKTTNT